MGEKVAMTARTAVSFGDFHGGPRLLRDRLRESGVRTSKREGHEREEEEEEEEEEMRLRAIMVSTFEFRFSQRETETTQRR